MTRAEPVTYPAFTIAFQPIVDVNTDCSVFAYEALVRGPEGESASSVLESVPTDQSRAFDLKLRQRAIALAHSLSLDSCLSLNLSPSVMNDPRYGIRSTLQFAGEFGFSPRRLIFEMTEREPNDDFRMLRRQITFARNRGSRIALDDCGAGYNGLGTIVELQPDIVKLDRLLIHKIDSDPARSQVVSSLADMCEKLGITLIAEGVETSLEAKALQNLGIRLMQGFLFGQPTVRGHSGPVANSPMRTDSK